LTKCGCFSTATDANTNNANVYIRTEGLTTKRILHILLWSTMLIEGIAYISMIVQLLTTQGDESTSLLSDNKRTYFLLDILGRSILEYTTFSILTVYWFDYLTKASSAAVDKRDLLCRLFRYILGCVSLIMIGANTFEAVVLFGGGNTTSYDTLSEFQTQSTVHRITLLISCISWGLHGIIVSICGGMVYRRIVSLPNFSAVGSRAKWSILCKMLFPIVCCAVSYAIRSGWYGVDYYYLSSSSRTQDDSTTNTTFERGAGWWIGNVWIPTLLPSLCLLYSVRKRDREPGSIDGVSESLLKGDYLMSGKNNDPFRNFNRVFRDLDDESAIVSVE
jgi:hypothetical protein